ncbi:MAG: gliding motility protein GldB [Bergeyella sp.]|nr:gliding motility protein GldB [Bergeyella sp.]
MKFLIKFLRYSFCLFVLVSCRKKPAGRWDIQPKSLGEKVEITDLSKEFYNPENSLENFKEKYPWFQGSVSDIDFLERKKDPEEIAIYREAIAKINLEKLSTDLSDLFSRVRYYFPKFTPPKVFLYSSALQGLLDPVFYKSDKNYLFIDISAFMGEKSKYYEGIERYIKKNLNVENLLPKTALIFAENIVPPTREHQKFIDHILYQGKLMILKDAFLPKIPDSVKIGYTPKQYEWAVANEPNIWDFFIENDLLFSDDSRLEERFIMPGPFSKFYTEIDNESSPQLGVFIGWQISKNFLEKYPEVSLQDFLRMSAKEIFQKSKYSPKFE